MNYNRRLYDLRTDNDLKQEDIAKVLNTTKQSYGRYENGTTKLSIEDLIKLAQYYNVSTDYLLGLTDDEKTNQEKQSLKHIDDSFKKIIVVKDNIKTRIDNDGIVTMGLYHFLLNGNSLDE